MIAVLIVAAFAAGDLSGTAQARQRLDAFAKCLAAKPAKMYGAYWCPHCADQKAMFESSFQYVPYVECGVPGSRDEAPFCKDAGIKHFPTWQFADGERQEGTLPLQTLGCEDRMQPAMMSPATPRFTRRILLVDRCAGVWRRAGLVGVALSSLRHFGDFLL